MVHFGLGVFDAPGGLGGFRGLAAFDGLGALDDLGAGDRVGVADGGGAPVGSADSDDIGVVGAVSGVAAPEAGGAVDGSGTEVGGATGWVRGDPEEAGPAARAVPDLEDGKGEAGLPETLGADAGPTRLGFAPDVPTRAPTRTPRTAEAPSATMLWVTGRCMVYTVNPVRRIPAHGEATPGADRGRHLRTLLL